MGFDFSELDAQLATLGSVRNDILQTARRLAGDTSLLADVDQALAALASNVNVNVSTQVARAARAKPKVEARPAPTFARAPEGAVPFARAPEGAVPFARAPEGALRPLVSAPSPVTDLPAASSKLGKKSVRPEAPMAAAPAERSGPPHSEEIALPDPVHHDASPRSGELALDDAAPRSGSFALDPMPTESNLDEDTDADFEAEFAALSGPDVSKSSAKATSIRPAAKAESIKPTAKAGSLKPEANTPASIKPVSADDEETDAVLALFDAAENAFESAPVPASAPIGGLSDELEPSMAPPAGNRDPDAEFDALFDEASSPSSMPSSPTADQDQDSVDDLLRDLGSPRVPQDLAFKKAAQAATMPAEDDSGEDPTGIFDMSAFDSVTGGPAGAQAASAPAEDDFEIEMEMDEVVEEVEAKPRPATSMKPMVAPPRPPPQPPVAPGGVEKRPSFLGRLFGGPNPKDPSDTK